MNNAEEKNTSHMIFYGEKDIDYTKSSNYAFLNWNLEKSKEGFRMTKRKIWIILFIIGIVMILGASEFSRFLANEINWYTAGIILSIVSGLGLLFEMYFRRNK